MASQTDLYHALEDVLLSGELDALDAFITQSQALSASPSLALTQSDSSSSGSDNAGTDASLIHAVRSIVSGNPSAVLAAEPARTLLHSLTGVRTKDQLDALNLGEELPTAIRSYLQSAGSDDATTSTADDAHRSISPSFRRAQLHVLLLAAASVHTFVGSNYAGPPEDQLAVLGEWPEEVRNHSKQWCSDKLKMDGEYVYEHSYHPITLLIARSIFLYPTIAHMLPDCKSLAWWSMRYTKVHHELLDANSATLKMHIDSIVPQALATYCPSNPPSDAAVSPLQTRLSTHLYLEACHLYHAYWQYKGIDECLSGAQRNLGIEVELSGVMGKRTKWQREEKAQLVCKITTTDESKQGSSIESDAQHAAADPAFIELMPHSIKLDSDVLLPQVALASQSGNELHLDKALSVTDQALLLCMAEHRAHTSGKHITRDEEQMAYIQRVLAESTSGRTSHRSWAIECNALFHRSVLECGDKHAQDRALQQLEELAALFDRLHAPTTVASYPDELGQTKSISDFPREQVVAIRMKEVYLSNYPSVWRMKQGIAATFQKIGLYKSALEVFESIQMFEGVIESSMLLGKISDAESMIRSQLELKPRDPKLLCLLADCTRDRSLYEEAWEASAHTYPRAQRSLAMDLMKHNEFAEAIPHFQLALDINPVFPDMWYAMGVCGMEIKDFQAATMAFSRTVSFDPEYGNAWNNLAAAHLHLKNKAQAFTALEQAVKFKTDSWKLWENYMVTAVDLHEYSKAMTAMDRIVSLKAQLNVLGEKEARSESEEKSGAAGQKPLDEEILQILKRVCMDVGAEDAQAFLPQRLLLLGQNIIKHLPTNACVYNVLADLYALRGDKEKSIAMREKEVRFRQTGAWLDRMDLLHASITAQQQLIDAYLESKTKSNLMAARFALDALQGKMSRAPGVTNNEDGKHLLRQVEGMQQRVAEALKTNSGASASSSSSSSSSSSLDIWR